MIGLIGGDGVVVSEVSGKGYGCLMMYAMMIY